MNAEERETIGKLNAAVDNVMQNLDLEIASPLKKEFDDELEMFRILSTELYEKSISGNDFLKLLDLATRLGACCIKLTEKISSVSMAKQNNEKELVEMLELMSNKLSDFTKDETKVEET